MKTAIEIENLAHNYGLVEALKPLDMSIESGTLFGFIGPDGAGKTTLFRILTSLLLPTQGTAKVLGLDVVDDYRKLRPLLGYMPGRFSLYQDLTVAENLQFFAKLFKTTIQENYHLIKDIYDQIAPFKNRLAGKLSGGMKQKLALSCALIHKPELLFLDEPTTGVDVVSRAEFWEMLRKLKNYGITIVVSTPYMDEAALCDKVALIQKGKILQTDSPNNITESFVKPLFSVKSNERNSLSKDIETFGKTDSFYWFGDSIRWIGDDEKDADLLRIYLQQKNHQALEIKKIKASIEDCFMDLMKGNYE
ncbi:MAG: ABC transporter ATP-binding protein [Bacteroidales bacterium]|nr:ABC transporter ATP-binding protein [Bacteroidales bacterium]